MQRMDYSIHPLLWEAAGSEWGLHPASHDPLPFQMFLLVLGNPQSMIKLPSVILLVTEPSLWGCLLRTSHSPIHTSGDSIVSAQRSLPSGKHLCTTRTVVHKIEHVLLAPWSFLSCTVLLFLHYTIMDLGDCMINIYPLNIFLQICFMSAEMDLFCPF